MEAVLRGRPTSGVRETLRDVLERQRRTSAPWLFFHRGATAEALSFAQAGALADGWARALKHEGVKPGDRVALLFSNAPDFLGAFLGAQLLGATAVPLPWPVVASAGAQLPKGAEAILRVAQVSALCAPGAVTGVEVPVVAKPLMGALDVSSDSPRAAFIQFTSGSTGSPRGAIISQRAAVTSATMMGEALGLTPADVGVSWLPFFHDMGLVGVLLSSLVTGFPVHLLQPGDFLLHPSRWLELLSQVRATITTAPNFAYELVLRRAGPRSPIDLRALRAMLNGSEPVLRSTLTAFEAKHAAVGLKTGAILPVYGLAENVLGVAFQAEGAPDADLPHEGRQVPSVGVPLPGMTVAIKRLDGSIAKEGEDGEICVQGDAVMDGYLGDDAATARALRGGWLWTGDRGVISNDRLYVTGREKELIIKAGRKYHPADIERLVAEVADSPPNGVAAFSVLDEATRGEALIVVVEQRRKSTDDLVARIRGRIADELGVMADRIELIGAGELPRTTSGKLRRGECIARYGGRA